MPLILDRVRAKPQSRATIKCCLCGNVDTACLISDSCPHTVCSTCAVDRQVVLMDSCLICNVASSYAPCAEFRCGFPGCSQTFENEDLAREHGDTCPVRLVRCRTCSQYCLENQCENHQCDLRVFSTATSPKNNSNKGSPLFMSPTKKQEQSTAENTNWSLIPLTAIRKMKKLNEGAQGAIWKCTIDGVAGTYAVKYMTIENDVESNEIYRRALRLTKLRNEHLIRYYTTWRNPLEKCVMIVMELYVEENLGFLIQSPSLRRIPEQTILSFGLQCGKALAYLHDVHKLVHCDVKPQNILMFDKQTRLVLTDLDSMQSSPFSSSGHEVEYAWSAPEFVKGQVVSTFADIWSLGVVLLVLASLPEFPSLKKGTEHVLLNDDAFSDEEQLHACLKKTLQARRYSDDFILLLKDMINHDPSKRPRAIAFSERVTEIMTSLLLES